MVKKNILLAGLASVLLSAGLAKAETVTSGDWSLNIAVAASGAKVCTATTVAGSATTDYQLAITASEVSPFQMTIKALGRGDLEKTIVSNLGGSQAVMSSAASVDGKQYWYIPNNSGDLIKAIKSGWQLPFQSVGNASQAVAFSLSGSSAILSFMETECNDGLKLENDVLLNKLQAKPINMASLTASKVSLLKSKYLKAHQALMGLDSAEVAIVSLETEFQEDLSKKDQIVQTRNYLSKTLIPALVKEQADIKRAIPQQKREATKLEAKAPALENKLAVTKSRYQALDSELRPLLAQEGRLIDSVAGYASDINSSSRAVDSLSSSIAGHRADAQKLKQKLSGLQSEIQVLQRKKESADKVMQDALKLKREFKAKEKVSRRLSSSSEYKRLQASIQQLAQKRKQLQGEIARLSTKLSQDKKAFQACKKAKKPDCSVQKKKVAATTAQLQQKKKELKSVSSYIKSKEQRSGQIKKGIQRDVNSKFKKIVAKADEATRRVRKIKKSLEGSRQEAARVRRKSESIKSTVASLRSQLENERLSLQSARHGHQNAKQDLAVLRQRHNIGAKKNKLQAAEDRYGEAYRDVKSARESATSLRSQVSSGQARLVSAKSQEVSSRQELADIRVEEARVDRGLMDYNNKKKTLDAGLIRQQKSVDVSIASYRLAL